MLNALTSGGHAGSRIDGGNPMRSGFPAGSAGAGPRMLGELTSDQAQASGSADSYGMVVTSTQSGGELTGHHQAGSAGDGGGPGGNPMLSADMDVDVHIQNNQVNVDASFDFSQKNLMVVDASIHITGIDPKLFAGTV